MDPHLSNGNIGIKYAIIGVILALILSVVMYRAVSWNGHKVVVDRAQYKAGLLVELTGGFVRTYSEYQARFADGKLPNPASYRAEALKHIEQGPRSGGLVSTGVVGLPGREIAEVARDESMRAQLIELEATPSTDVLSTIFNKNGRDIHRSLWSFIALEQTCADCHNRLQGLTGNNRWQVGQLMGAQIVEQDIEEQLAAVRRTAIVQAFLLFAAVLGAWFWFVYLINHFRLNKELKKLATTDPLTGCINRREIQNRMARIKGSTKGALLMIDLDKFKLINDSHGHDAGDEVICDFSRRVQHSLRANDWIARFGGEEFIIWLQDAKPIDAIRVAERLRIETEQQTVLVNGSTIRYTVSIGLHIVLNAPSTGIDAWIRAADKLVYRAKMEGRNRIVADVGMTA